MALLSNMKMNHAKKMKEKKTTVINWVENDERKVSIKKKKKKVEFLGNIFKRTMLESSIRTELCILSYYGKTGI